MSPRATPLVLALLLAGCATNSVNQVGERPREAITFAAQAIYPGNVKTSDYFKAVALYDSSRKTIDLYNLSSQVIPATAVWVNGRFVSRASAISPKSRVSLPYSELIEAGVGVNDFSQMQTVPVQVELQTKEGLYTVLGPVAR